MDVHAFSEMTSMPLVQVADAVRAAQVGEEVRVFTNVEALIRDMHAFAHMSGNKVTRVEASVMITVDLHKTVNDVFSADQAAFRSTEPGWVIVLKVLPTNRLASRNG